MVRGSNLGSPIFRKPLRVPPRKSCKSFSSNFLAGRKHSAFMKKVWEAPWVAVRGFGFQASPKP